MMGIRCFERIRCRCSSRIEIYANELDESRPTFKCTIISADHAEFHTSGKSRSISGSLTWVLLYSIPTTTFSSLARIRTPLNRHPTGLFPSQETQWENGKLLPNSWQDMCWTCRMGGFETSWRVFEYRAFFLGDSINRKWWLFIG